jgi:hypothetical protein
MSEAFMSWYAVFLGAVITGVYGYAAQAAIAVDLSRLPVEIRAPAAGTSPDRIWYGGTLAPVTVEAWSPQASAISRPADCKVPDRRG